MLRVQSFVQTYGRTRYPYGKRIQILSAGAHLRDIGIPVPLNPLHILLLDQLLHLPLDVSRLHHAPRLRRLNRLRNQLCVSDLFPALHDPHNRSLGFVLSVCGDALVGFFVLFEGLFELYGVDLDAKAFVREVVVECECIGGVDVASSGMLR